jgi:hypothetical protein
MGALAQGLQSAGQTASDFGQAKFDFADWQQRQRQQRLAEIIQGVRLQQIQQQLRQANQPQPYGTAVTAKGLEGITFDPTKGTYSTQQLAQRVPGYHDVKTGENGLPYGINDATGVYEEIAHPAGMKLQAVHADDPIKDLQARAIMAGLRGDKGEEKKYLDLIQEVSGAKRAIPKPNEIELYMRAQRGDPEAIGALRELQKNRKDVMMTRAMGYGLGRIGNYYNPDTGETSPMIGLDAMNAIKGGKDLKMVGVLPSSTILTAQRVVNESGPAFANVRRDLKTFDNPSDRLIFARVLNSNPMSEQQDPHVWFGTVLNQALTGGLSPEGRQFVIDARRLNETISGVRGIMGLPATNSATSLTLQLVPGPATPDSKFATEQLNQLEQVVKQAVSVPILGGGASLGQPSGSKSPATSVVPPPGAKIRDYTDIK